MKTQMYIKISVYNIACIMLVTVTFLFQFATASTESVKACHYDTAGHVVPVEWHQKIYTLFQNVDSSVLCDESNEENFAQSSQDGLIGREGESYKKFMMTNLYIDSKTDQNEIQIANQYFQRSAHMNVMAVGSIGFASTIPTIGRFSLWRIPTVVQKIALHLLTGSVVTAYVLQRVSRRDRTFSQMLDSSTHSSSLLHIQSNPEDISSQQNILTSSLEDAGQLKPSSPKDIIPIPHDHEEDELLDYHSEISSEGTMIHRLFQSYVPVPYHVEENVSQFFDTQTVSSYLNQYSRHLLNLAENIAQFHSAYDEALRSMERDHRNTTYENLGLYISKYVFQTYSESVYWYTFREYMDQNQSDAIEIQLQNHRHKVYSNNTLFLSAPFDVFGLKMIKMSEALSELSHDLIVQEPKLYAKIEHKLKSVRKSLRTLGIELMSLKDRLSIHLENLDEYFFYPITSFSKSEIYSMDYGLNISVFVDMIRSFSRYFQGKSSSWDAKNIDLMMPKKLPLLHEYTQAEKRMKLAVSVTIHLLGQLKEVIWKNAYLDEYSIDEHTALKEHHEVEVISYEDDIKKLNKMIKDVANYPQRSMDNFGTLEAEDSIMQSRLTQTFVQSLGYLHALRKRYQLTKDDMEHHITAWKRSSSEARHQLIFSSLPKDASHNEGQDALLWDASRYMLVYAIFMNFLDAYENIRYPKNHKINNSIHRLYWLYERASYEIQGLEKYVMTSILESNVREVNEIFTAIAYKKSYYDYGEEISNISSSQELINRANFTKILSMYPTIHELRKQAVRVLFENKAQ